jgi:molybdopterin converting factor small subunit
MNAQNEWFDNQANSVEWVDKPQYTDQFTVEELKEKLLQTNQYLEAWGEAYKVTQSEELLQKVMKTTRFRAILRLAIIKRQRDSDDPLFNELREVKAEKHKLHKENIQLMAIISKLKSKLQGQIQANEGLLKGLATQKQKVVNVQKSNFRNNEIHCEFKEIIKRELGMERYLVLIKEADVAAEEKCK